MKTIGLIGGMSWESSLEYYRIINQAVHERLGGFHSARCVMYSVDFAEVEEHMPKDRWDKIAEIVGAAAVGIEKCGADLSSSVRIQSIKSQMKYRKISRFLSSTSLMPRWKV